MRFDYDQVSLIAPIGHSGEKIGDNQNSTAVIL